MKSYNRPDAELLRIRSERLLIETSIGVESADDAPLDTSVKGGSVSGGSAISQLAGFQPGETNLP